MALPRYRADWSEFEVRSTIDAYLDMLLAELRGDAFVKTQVNENLRSRLNGRSKGSVEYKFQNVSAVLIELGVAYVKGYKPASNYQGLLGRIVSEVVDGNNILAEAMKRSALNTPTPPVSELPLLQLVDAPKRDEKSSKNVYVNERLAMSPRRVNWLEVEAQNRSRGALGEKLVLEYEERRLRAEGKKDLANRIEHVSVSRGDGLGYDIHSFESTGMDRLIEVKATMYGEYTPFFASRNEVSVSAELADQWHLYRVFSLYGQPKHFERKGSLAEQFALEPVTYEARVI